MTLSRKMRAKKGATGTLKGPDRWSTQRSRAPAATNKMKTPERYASGSLSRPSSSLLTPQQSHINEILEKLEMVQAERRQDEVLEKLAAIQARVIKALRHGNVAGSLFPTESEEFEIMKVITGPPVFDLKKKRKELEFQRRLLDTLSNFLSSCIRRQGLMSEVRFWFDSSANMNDCLITDDEMEERAREMAESSNSVREAMKYTGGLTDKLKLLGFKLMKEAGYYNSDDDDDEESGPRQPRKKTAANTAAAPVTSGKVLDENALLADQNNFDTASTDIRVVLEQTVRMVRTNQQKTLVRGGLKQYKFFVKAVLARLTELKICQDLTDDLKIEVERLKAGNAGLQEALDEAELAQQQDNSQEIIAELQNAIEQLEASLDEAEEERVSLNTIIADLEEELRLEVEKPPPRPPSVVTLTRSQLGPTESHVNVRNELVQVREQLEQEMKKNADLERELKDQEENVAKLEAKVTMAAALDLEKKTVEAQIQEQNKLKMNTLLAEHETLERQVARLKSELNCKHELIEYQERRLADMKQELGTINFQEFLDGSQGGAHKDPEMRRVMTKMKKEFETEISRLKDHLAKEKQRGDAALRRLEQTHKDQYASIYKQSIHLLRALNRFKGSIVTMLEREHLPAAAADVKKIADLPVEEAPTDTRLLLAQTAGNAVELLVSIEFKLSQALMNKRIEVKDNSIARTFAAKDLEAQMETTTRLRQTADTLQDKIKVLQEDLSKKDDSLKTIQKTEDEKYKNVVERYQQLWIHYTRLRKEMTTVQTDFSEVIKGKEKSLKTLFAQKREMSKMLEEQSETMSKMSDHIRQRCADKEALYQLSMSDHNHNLRLLKDLYRENRVSREIYFMSVDVIHQLLNLPAIKMKMLFEKYIIYRRLKDATVNLRKRMEENILISKKSSLEAYLKAMDSRISQTMENWKEEREKLEIERKRLFQKMSKLFGEVVLESGALRLMPESKKHCLDSRASSSISSIPSSRGHLLPLKTSCKSLELPKEIIGERVTILGEPEKMWTLPALPASVAKYGVDTPHVMEMDVNQRMRAAQKVLFRNHIPMEVPIVQGYDYQEMILRPLCDAHNKAKKLAAQTITVPSKFFHPDSDFMIIPTGQD